MILKSKQCKKCPGDDVGSTRTHWNISKDCEKDQGTCKKCNECPNGYRTSSSCSKHSDENSLNVVRICWKRMSYKM